MKKALATVGQFLLFLFIFAVGSFLWHPFNLHWAMTASAHASRYFVPDGLLLALGVFLAILAVQALRKRLCDSPWTVLSFALAVAIGYALKFGVITKDVF
jgi:xanthine/uracil permease